MIRLFAVLAAAFFVAACHSSKEPIRQLPIAKAGVLPLELSDDFRFKKVSLFLHDPHVQRATLSQSINFERLRLNYGAVNGTDRAERFGHYFNVWWASKHPADLTVRLEYRQENLGSHVQAREYFYPQAKGTIETKFTVIGDDYTEDGKVTAWRLLLIENNRVVGLRQSFLWN